MLRRAVSAMCVCVWLCVRACVVMCVCVCVCARSSNKRIQEWAVCWTCFSTPLTRTGSWPVSFARRCECHQNNARAHSLTHSLSHTHTHTPVPTIQQMCGWAIIYCVYETISYLCVSVMRARLCVCVCLCEWEWYIILSRFDTHKFNISTRVNCE